MLATIRKIGNSRGLIIPAPLLAACGIESSVELTVEAGKLIVEASKPVRAGWFVAEDATDPAYGDAALWDRAEASDDEGDWEW